MKVFIFLNLIIYLKIKHYLQIMSTLPRAWLQGGTIEELKMFASLIREVTDHLDQGNPAHK